MSTKLDQLATLLIKASRLAAELRAEEIEAATPKRSDSQLIGDLHKFAWNLWCKSAASPAERKLIHRSKLMEYLSFHCDADKAMHILALTCQMGWLEQQPDTLLFLPKHRGLIQQN